MSKWNLDDLRRLDARYAKDGVSMHQRPFRAAVDILGADFSIGPGGNPRVQAIMDAYKAMVPEAAKTWPGMGVGLSASVDQVRKVVVPVLSGTRLLQAWEVHGFSSEQEWWIWCREDENIAARAAFAIADLLDFTYGMIDCQVANADAQEKWHMAASSLGDVANALPSVFSVDSIVQPICMAAELSLKAALIANGAIPKSFKGPSGHDFGELARRLATELPHRDDPLVRAVVAELPHYVESRYRPEGLTRLKVVELALGVQFVAASSVRRWSRTDFAAQMETGSYPSTRPPFFS